MSPHCAPPTPRKSISPEATSPTPSSRWTASAPPTNAAKTSNYTVPPRAIRELRDLTRYRSKLVQAAGAERNRLLKLLESVNIKLSGVASDVFGVSGWAMLQALVEGKQTPAEMAQLAQRRMRRKLAELERALHGRLEEHHRFLLGVRWLPSVPP